MRLPASDEDHGSATAWEACHRGFRAALVSACGSDWLLGFLNTPADHSERYRKLRLLRHREAKARVRDLNAEHQEIMRAVIGREAGRAADLMDAHLAQTEAAMARPMETAEGEAR